MLPRRISIGIISMLVASPRLLAQAPAKPASVTLEEVLKWHSDGLPVDVIISRLRRAGKPFDLNSDEIAELQRLGISENVLKYLQDPSLPYNPPPPPVPKPVQPVVSRKPAKPPADPLVLKIPPEVGIYSLENGETPIQLELKPLVASKQPGKLGAMLTGGLLKGQIVASIAGTAAKVRLRGGDNILYARLGEKTAPEDLVLVTLTKADERRDINFGAKPGTPSFPVVAVRQFHSREGGEGVVLLLLHDLTPGEYLFFILGSWEEKKGTLGKGWEFGVE